MSTLERVLANDDGDNAGRIMVGEVEMYANYGKAPGEVDLTHLGREPFMGRVALSRSPVTYGSEYWQG